MNQATKTTELNAASRSVISPRYTALSVAILKRIKAAHIEGHAYVTGEELYQHITLVADIRVTYQSIVKRLTTLRLIGAIDNVAGKGKPARYVATEKADEILNPPPKAEPPVEPVPAYVGIVTPPRTYDVMHAPAYQPSVGLVPARSGAQDYRSLPSVGVRC